jgi:hypothetical protein
MATRLVLTSQGQSRLAKINRMFEKQNAGLVLLIAEKTSFSLKPVVYLGELTQFSR